MNVNNSFSNENKFNFIESENLYIQKINKNNDNNHILSKKRKKMKENNSQNLKKRKDYIYKQIKIHALKFAIQTINELLKPLIKLNLFNSFYILKNKFNNEFKDNLTKQFNIQLIDLTLKEILNKYSNNHQVLNKIEELNDNEYYKLTIYKLLNLKFIELINIYVGTNDDFKNNFGYENKFLFINDLSILNKKEIEDLINNGITVYLYNKKDKQEKKYK